MFLALNEIKFDKARFILIIAIVTLIGYLTYFLTALAYGLATSYTQGINKWDADAIILQNKANNNIGRSLLYESDFESINVNGEKARLGVSATTIEADGKTDVSLFGIDKDSFLLPNITEGRLPGKDSEVIVSDDLKSVGLSLNNNIKFSDSGDEYTVVGFTDQATFQTLPIVYFSLPEWRDITAKTSGMTGMIDDSTINAVIVRGSEVSIPTDRLSSQTIREFSFTLPGYNAQVLTFGTMIGFLIFISSFVLSIFIYILTTQKKPVFGVLKAEGIPNKYIMMSVLTQTIFLAAIGLLFALLLTIGTGLAIPAEVPFLIQPYFFLGISGLFIICAIIGGIASVRVVTKIDPVESIS